MNTESNSPPTNYGLPPFKFSRPVRAETARQDKIEMEIVFGKPNDNDLCSFLSLLGVPPRDDRSSPDTAYGLLFKRPRKLELPYGALEIREAPLPLGCVTKRPPLFTGKLLINCKEGTVTNIRADLYLNPTRYVRHLGLPRPASRVLEKRPRRFRPFKADQETLQDHVLQTGEFSMESNDNWIPNSRLWHLMTEPTYWKTHLRSYLRGVKDTIESEVEHAANCSHIIFSRPARKNPLVVHHVETYWEFYQPDAPETMRHLQKCIEKIDEPTITLYEERGRSSRRAPKVPCITISNRRGETITIYAKTNSRVRVEVRHQLAGNNRFQQVKRHSFSSIESIVSLTDQLAREAAKEVNRLFDVLNRSINVRSHKTPVSLITDLTIACKEDTVAAQALINLLLTYGAITTSNNSLASQYKEHLRRLKNQKILLYRSRRYVVSGEYQAALDVLRELPGNCELKGRIRRKGKLKHLV